MSAFIIVDTKITDAEAYEEYKKLAKPIAEKFGGVYRTRGGDMEILESDLWSPTRIVVVEFPDMESAKAFAASKEYAPVQAIRHANAECTLIIVDGL
ncbi:MAG: DUF1330 domain-containing protein [Gammaproteobacteria bacterium]|nr:DUF1330 domain-containing protein [Gammaproteobacteria bacterium]